MTRPGDPNASESADGWQPTRTALAIGAFFGLFYLGWSVVIFAAVDVVPFAPVGGTLLGIFFGGVGLEAIIASIRGRRSFLSKVGPWP